jgi:Mrp family chromosome partitioning ATPase
MHRISSSSGPPTLAKTSLNAYPSLSPIFGSQKNKRWVPVSVEGTPNLKVISIGFLLQNNDDAVVWRGPKKTGLFGLPSSFPSLDD